MMNYLKKIITVLKVPKLNRISPQTPVTDEVQRAKERIFKQAALTVMTIVLTVFILFAMTSAWYTNVVQTSGLTFEAEAWGFEGNITVDDESIISAAPGDEGIINLTVENDNDSVSAISVNVSKNAMEEEMQKRLFFYVDTRMSRNGEIMDRVYLNRLEGYTYNVFNDTVLSLTEEYSNAPVIKWEWVYDVLGYYVLGKPVEITSSSETETASETEGADVLKTMYIEEYLRPIIYDFDEATTLINTEGEEITVELSTVDGVPPEDFLAELSRTDGYEGNIEPAFGNYYEVDVDEDGYGVYAYLCSYAEIQTAMDYDTYLGNIARKQENGDSLTEAEQQKLQHRAVLNLSAQKDDSTAITVNTVSGLQQALAMENVDVVQLTGNITTTEADAIQIPANSRVMMDLNGYTLTSTEGTAITAQPGSSLTLTNGTLQYLPDEQSEETNPATPIGIKAVGAEVVMSKVSIKDFQHGVYVGDNTGSNELDSRVHILNSTIAVENCAAFISGNGLLSDQKSQLIIEGSKLSSHNIVVAGNGDTTGNGRWGTDIQIINSTITGIAPEGSAVTTGVGIYQPQKNSTLTVLNSTVTGSTGIALKGGSAEIDHSTISGVGAFTEPSFDGNGFTNTGDAIYIETNYGYEIYLWVSNDSTLKVSDEKCMPIRVYKEDAENVLVERESSDETEEAAQ